MNAQLFQHWSNHHKELRLSKGSVPILCPPSGACSGSAPAAGAQGSELAACAICSRHSHSHHKLWMDTGYLSHASCTHKDKPPLLKTVTVLLQPTRRDGGISSQEQILNVTVLVKRRIYCVGVYSLGKPM